MIMKILDWIAGVESANAGVKLKGNKTPRQKNNAELREHVVVAKDGELYTLYTHDFTRSILPTEAEKRACFYFKDKIQAIAAGRQLIRKLHSTQPNPALVI